MEIILNDNKYELMENYKDAYDKEEFLKRATDYFKTYDYIVGDWAYGKLRLKGFNEKTNKNYKKINDCKLIDNYLKDYCAFGCRYFILKKISVEK